LQQKINKRKKLTTGHPAKTAVKPCMIMLETDRWPVESVIEPK